MGWTSLREHPVTITKDVSLQKNAVKLSPKAPILLHMVNPISSAHASQANEAAQAAVPKPQPPQTQQASPQPSDTVQLKSTGGDVDHDSDSR